MSAHELKSPSRIPIITGFLIVLQSPSKQVPQTDASRLRESSTPTVTETQSKNYIQGNNESDGRDAIFAEQGNGKRNTELNIVGEDRAHPENGAFVTSQMKTFSADKKGEQKNQSARAEVSQSDAPIRRRQIRCSADGLEKQAGNSNVESELGQSLADIKVDKG